MRLRSILSVALFYAFAFRAMGAGVSSLIFNEIMPGNIDMFVDPSWNYGGWVEIYNPTGSVVDLKGCWLSDDPSNLRKFRIAQSTPVPANGFKVLWFEHYDKFCLTQINMKLNPEGGSLFLSSALGTLAAQVDYPASISRASYARLSDGADEWGWTNDVTPEESNGNITPGMTQLSAPEVDLPGHIYSRYISINVTNIPEGATLKYTMNGSAPSKTNGFTSNGMLVASTTRVYRMAFFKDGYLMSPVVTHSYIRKDKDFTLPVISVSSEQANFTSDQLGIFVRGVNGRRGNGQSTPCNWNMDWDRPCNFELFDADGKPLINQEAEIARAGGWSRAWTPYSFKIHAAKLFEGKNTLDAPIFERKPYLKYKTFLMRNGGNDSQYRVTDAFLQEIIQTSGLDVDGQAYTPAVHYLNGEYMGLINIREPNNKQFVYANYGLDDTEIDFFEVDADSGYVQTFGTSNAFDSWYTLSRNATDPKVYEQICKKVDIDEYTNYMACELYLGNSDWPQNNLKGWRPRSQGGKFRFIIYDLDGAIGNTNALRDFESRRHNTFNPLYDCDVPQISEEIKMVSIFMNMLKNDTFRKRFVDTYCLVAGSVFEPARCDSIINKLAKRVAMMQVIPNGYNITASPWDKANWLSSTLSDWAQKMIPNLKNFGPMQLSRTPQTQMTLSSDHPLAHLYINDLKVPTGYFNGTLFYPLTLRAEAPAGYQFVGWRQKSQNKERTTLKPLASMWLYYDQGGLDEVNWHADASISSSWSKGSAPLGYASDESPFNTLISYGNDSGNKHITYYFVSNVNLDDALQEDEEIELKYLVDDGFVIYVNGKEAGRYNMPDGKPLSTTTSLTYAGNDPFVGTLTLDKSAFQKGDNLVAVEVHNTSATSSDIYWDGSIDLISPISGNHQTKYASVDKEWTLPENVDVQEIVACFEKKPASSTDYTTQAPIRINEVGASNSIYVNEFYKKNDWIELYNMTDEDIDLHGMYLSDDEKDPTKYMISGGSENVSTIIPAYGYRIIWADKLEPQSQLHTKFKLTNASGERVVLTASDMAWADTLIYCAHDGMESVGRYPDGSDQVFTFTRPTIAASNQLTPYSTAWIVPDSLKTNVNPIEESFYHAGGLHLQYADGQLLASNENGGHTVLKIYHIDGHLQRTHVLENPLITNTIPTSDLPQGIFIAQISDDEGNSISVKFKR